MWMEGIDNVTLPSDSKETFIPKDTFVLILILKGIFAPNGDSSLKGLWNPMGIANLMGKRS